MQTIRSHNSRELMMNIVTFELISITQIKKVILFPELLILGACFKYSTYCLSVRVQEVDIKLCLI